ncbi:MAG: class I SAM-dependent methyltransferase, partial [Lachnospiraceae bacterium]|nr:class I SAM-dependent methyltransferase [Lachnospiraceae bacterium]
MLDHTGFNLWANDYDKTVSLCEEDNEYPFAGYKSVLNTIYNRIRTGGGKCILDIGFGTGILSKRLYDEGVQIYGIDFSEEMIKLAKEKMPDATLLEYDFSKGLPGALKE